MKGLLALGCGVSLEMTVIGRAKGMIPQHFDHTTIRDAPACTLRAWVGLERCRQ